MSYRPDTPEGLKPKDLIGLPWKIAFALQADGWYLRSDIIWNKPNCQPESVKDRPTRAAHESVLLFSKSEKYYFNQAGMVEPATGTQQSKNRRTVWNINTEPYKGARFAVFPSKLVELCVLGGSAAGSGTVGAVA